MKLLARLLSSFTALAWLLWFSVQAKWSEVIAPNIGWVLLGTIVTSIIVWWLTRKKEVITTALIKKEEVIVPRERLVAKEIYTWRTVTRERTIYSPRRNNVSNV